jgi:hypothetical protein
MVNARLGKFVQIAHLIGISRSARSASSNFHPARRKSGAVTSNRRGEIAGHLYPSDPFIASNRTFVGR